MTAGHPITNRVRTEMRRRRKLGQTRAEIGAALGVCIVTVTLHAGASGRRPTQALTRGQICEVRHRRRDGVSVAAVCQAIKRLAAAQRSV
jgi:hypothetical protein